MISFFKNIFSKKETIVVPDFSEIAVDMHSHLLPGIDDGCKTKEESIEIITYMLDNGFQKIITTPHTMKGGYDNTTDIIQNACADLNLILKEDKNLIQIQAASEYYFDGHFEKLIAENDILTIQDNKVLFEFSFMYPPNDMYKPIFNLSVEGYQPILAHPERYPYLFTKSLNKYRELKDKGVMLQLNLFSLVGAYGDGAKQIANALINEQLVDYVGSDIHNPTQLRYFELLKTNTDLAKLIDSAILKNKKLSS